MSLDYEKGADTGERLGPTRAVQAGLVTPGQMRRGMWLAFALATAAGVYLTWIAGWPILAIGVASIVSGIAYTGGPYPLGYHGLGDVFVLIFFGFVAVCGTAFINLGTVPDSGRLGVGTDRLPGDRHSGGQQRPRPGRATARLAKAPWWRVSAGVSGWRSTHCCWQQLT